MVLLLLLLELTCLLLSSSLLRLFLLMFSLSIFCHHRCMSYYGDASSSSAICIVFKTVFPFSSGIHLSTYYSVLQYKHCKKKKGKSSMGTKFQRIVLPIGVAIKNRWVE